MHPLRLRNRFLFTLAFAPLATPLAAPTISGQVIGPDGQGIASAIVFVQEPAAGPAAAAAAATMDQVDKAFVPNVLPIVVGTPVRFPNRDQIHHHVYSFSRAKRFELPLYKGEDAPPVLFDKPGVVKIGCNIHDWMSAVILVLPNQHYAVTNADGSFDLTGLAAGTYTLAAWHAQSREKLADTAQRVEVGSNDLKLSFKLQLAPSRPRPATRGARWQE